MSGKPYICADCRHGLVLHEIDEDGQRAACCVEGCSCGHTLLGVVGPPETQAEHREKRREMYEGLHALPTRLGMLPGYTKEKP